MSLADVVCFNVPDLVIEKTERSLQKAGSEGYELFVLWSGTQNADEFDVRSAHVPRQTSYRTEEGLLVRVDGEALHKLNVWLYENEEQLAAQVHAHPNDAFHSDTDDTFAIAAQLGSLSLVVADFCANGLLHPSSAAFRLMPTGWEESELLIADLLKVQVV